MATMISANRVANYDQLQDVRYAMLLGHSPSADGRRTPLTLLEDRHGLFQIAAWSACRADIEIWRLQQGPCFSIALAIRADYFDDFDVQ